MDLFRRRAPGGTAAAAAAGGGGGGSGGGSSRMHARPNLGGPRCRQGCRSTVEKAGVERALGMPKASAQNGPDATGETDHHRAHVRGQGLYVPVALHNGIVGQQPAGSGRRRRQRQRQRQRRCSRRCNKPRKVSKNKLSSAKS